MNRWIKIIGLTLLLVGGAVLCAIRWQAWFGMPAEPQWNDEVREYTFPAFENDSTPASLDILVLGDIHSRLTRHQYDSLAAHVPQADLVMQVGDWMERGQEYYYQLLLREWMESNLFGLPVIAAPGNHEYSKGLCKTLSPVWDKAFARPDNGPKGVPGSSYYVDLPNMRCIVIDTNPLVRLTHLTRTLTWLRALQKSAADRHVIVMMHHPVLSPAQGRFNPLIYATFRHALGQADLVLAGHDHSYMRCAPFVVLNTSGKPKAQHFRFTPEVTDTVPVYGVLSIEASRPTLQFNVYRLDDHTLIDSLYVKHH